MLRIAAELHRPLARAAKRADFNGKLLAFCGGLSLAVTLLLVDPVGIALSVIVTAAGVFEVRQGRRLAAADDHAPLWLCRNELVLGAVLSLFWILNLTVWRDMGAELSRQLGGAGLEDMGIDVEGWYESLSLLTYSTLLAATFLYQGGMARYFLKQREPLERYLDEVEPWAREVMQTIER